MAQADFELVQRAQAGDRAALEEIFEAHYTAIYNYVFYRVPDEATAKDIAAEVFARMVEKIGTFKNQGKPILAWLYTIARNLIHDWGRESTKFTSSEFEGLSLQSKNRDLSELAHLALTQRELAIALDTLTETQKQVILLRFVQGYKMREIGELLDKSEGAIKLLQHRALAAMREVITREMVS